MRERITRILCDSCESNISNNNCGFYKIGRRDICPECVDTEVSNLGFNEEIVIRYVETEAEEA